MKKYINYTYLCVFAADLLALSVDTTATWTSPMFIFLNSTDPEINPIGRPITILEQSWIGSILNIGAIVGPFPSGWLAYKYGRKIGMLSLAIPQVIAFLILSFSKEIGLYYFARFLNGIAIGGGSTLLPMYIAEIAEDSNRGALSVTLNIFWTLGNFIPLGIGPYMRCLGFNLLLSCFAVLFFVTFLLVAPETPYYLVSKSETARAESSLMKLRSKSKEGVQSELLKIQNSIKNEVKTSFKNLLNNRSIVKALIISVTLLTLQQLSGINAVLFYAQSIFEVSGSKFTSDINSVIIGLVIFSSSFFTPFVVDRLGRRKLIMISSTGMFLSLVVFGVYFYLLQKTSLDTSVVSFLPILSLVFYILNFNFGLSPIPWTLSSELFPSNAKSFGATVTSLACWITSFIITNFFNDMLLGIGTYGTFWLFGAFCLVAGGFTFVFVPETKGKSFTEIQKELDS